MWDGLLTDEDGPYVELMFGSFSDNQPITAGYRHWRPKRPGTGLHPLKGMKGVSNVNENAVIDLEVRNDSLLAAINVTSAREGAGINLYRGDDLIFEAVEDLHPQTPFVLEIPVPADDTGEGGDNNFSILLRDAGGIEIAGYTVQEPGDDPMPEPVSSPLAAEEISDADSLYYAGLQFEQFHDPYYMPLDYYLKALTINPYHVPALTRTGILYIKSGDFEKAAGYLEKAVARVTTDYTVAENGAPLYYLAVAYSKSGRENEAYSLLYRASWDYSFRSPARFQLALIDSRKSAFNKALDHLRHASATNAVSTDILSMKVSLNRLTGDT
jgi:hypothetical protein